MSIKAILFDFDGTIADTSRIIMESWQAVYREICGKEEDETVILRSYGEPLETSINKIFPGREEECLNIYRTFQRERFLGNICMFPGMKELIVKLKEQGYKTAIVTSRVRYSTQNAIEAFGLTPYIDTIISCDDCVKHKPDKEPAIAALNVLGVRPEEALMIGDSRFDLMCAADAGVKSVLVKWEGEPVVFANLHEEADFCISEANELFYILQELNKC